MANQLMEKFLRDDLGKMIPRNGQVIKGKLLFKQGPTVYVNIGLYQTGVIFGVEYYLARDLLKNCKIGDEINVKIKEVDTKNGNIELSLKEAGEEVLFADLKEKMKKGETIIVKIKGANKGGLIAEIDGVPAFMPSSRLSVKNYPKVDDASPAKIAQELAKFVNTEMEVRVITVDEEEKKVVISQKEIEKELLEKNLENQKIGDKITVKIKRINDFGVFVIFQVGDYEYEGLVPPVEIVNKEALKPDDEIETKIINKENGRIYLSMKS